jgi:hypothetical protein
MPFAEMDVLQGGCVNNDVGANPRETPCEADGIADIAKRIDDIQTAVNTADALHDIEQAVIELIEQNQPAAFERSQVFCDGRANASRRAGDDDAFAPIELLEIAPENSMWPLQHIHRVPP